MIKKVASGLYSWLPLGLKVFRKVEAIVREEMDRSGALELMMPVVQPADLWQESKRWSQFGPELLRIKDRHDREFCLRPMKKSLPTLFVVKLVATNSFPPTSIRYKPNFAMNGGLVLG